MFPSNFNEKDEYSLRQCNGSVSVAKMIDLGINNFAHLGEYECNRSVLELKIRYYRPHREYGGK